jgi:hypothetical protein
MKKILRISALFLLVAATFSCEDDDIPAANMMTPQNGPVLITPSSGTSVVLSPDYMANPAITLAWEDAAYSVQTPITYNVEFAATGTDFAAPFVVATTTTKSVTWTVEQLNGIAISPSGLNLAPFTAHDIDVRIVSGVGLGTSEPIASNIITINVTPYTTDNPTIAVPGNHQGWAPASAPLMASSGYGETDYEGYMWLDGGFKFLAPKPDGTFDWGTTDWGDNGDFSGVLAETGESDCTASAGYYYVKADTAALTYSTQLANWGVIGDGTPTGWDSDTDMVYDATSKTWSLDVQLTAGLKFKFRANDGWDINFGDTDPDGVLNAGGADIDTPGTGMYHIVLDLSHPRAYTYTVTAL